MLKITENCETENLLTKKQLLDELIPKFKNFMVNDLKVN